MDLNYPSQQNIGDNDSIDIKRYLSLFMSNWYWFAIALFISFTIAYGINRYSQKIFSVSSTLLIKDDQNGNMGAIATSVIPGGDIFKSQQNLKNEIEIIKSFHLNLMVMNELKDFHVVYYGVGRRNIVESVMYKNCPFKVTYDSLESGPNGVKVEVSILNESDLLIGILGKEESKIPLKFGEIYSNQGFRFKIEKRNKVIPVYSERKSNNYFFYFADPARLANQYRAKLIVVPKDQDASVVSLSVSGFVKEQEIDYLNKLMDVYIEYGLALKKEIAEKTLIFINQQLEIISDSLKVASNDLQNFRLSNNFIDLKNEVTSVQDRLENEYIEKSKLDMQIKYYNYLFEYIDANDSVGSIISPSFIGITDQVLLNLVNELSILQKDKIKLSFNLDENQSAYKYIDKKILTTKEALKENIKNSLGNLNLSKAETEADISLVEKEYKRLPLTEKTYVDIQRQFELNNTIYTYLLEKRAESGIAQASTLADNRPIDRAQLRGQVKPKESNNYMIAFLLGVLIPGSFIFLIDFFNNKVIDKKDIVRATKVPVIGYIGHSELMNEIAVVEKPGSSLSESFRSIRTSLKYFVRDNEVPVIAVSSTISSEGKTFISVNLASIIATLGKKVLLMGLDLRKPRINRIFEFDKSPGMSNYLIGNCEFDEIIMKTHIENLFYVPSGPVPPNPAELIESDRMKIFMDRARKEYDYIVFDTPPVAIVTDALLLGKYANINLFIVRQRYSSINTLDLIEQLKNNGELLNMAIIINDISLSGYYGYGLRYGYNYGYGYTYGTAYYSSNYYEKHGKLDKGYKYYNED